MRYREITEVFDSTPDTWKIDGYICLAIPSLYLQRISNHSRKMIKRPRYSYINKARKLRRMAELADRRGEGMSATQMSATADWYLDRASLEDSPERQ